MDSNLENSNILEGFQLVQAPNNFLIKPPTDNIMNKSQLTTMTQKVTSNTNKQMSNQQFNQRFSKNEGSQIM